MTKPDLSLNVEYIDWSQGLGEALTTLGTALQEYRTADPARRERFEIILPEAIKAPGMIEAQTSFEGADLQALDAWMREGH